MLSQLMLLVWTRSVCQAAFQPYFYLRESTRHNVSKLGAWAKGDCAYGSEDNAQYTENLASGDYQDNSYILRCGYTQSPFRIRQVRMWRVPKISVVTIGVGHWSSSQGATSSCHVRDRALPDASRTYRWLMNFAHACSGIVEIWGRSDARLFLVAFSSRRFLVH